MQMIKFKMNRMSKEIDKVKEEDIKNNLTMIKDIININKVKMIKTKMLQNHIKRKTISKEIFKIGIKMLIHIIKNIKINQTIH
jgi:hypothetical protein